MIYDERLKSYIGSMTQIGGVKRYTISEGWGKGLEIAEIDNGSGSVFTIILDNGMDIYRFKYRGKNVSYISEGEIASPFFFDGRGYEWLQGFYGGLFTTCGLVNNGGPCAYNSREYELHDEYSKTPAENVSINQNWIDGRYCISISGSMRLGTFLSEDIVLKREITAVLGLNEIIIDDTVENNGNVRQPFMLGYYFNFGYPLLNENSKIVVPVGEISPMRPEYEALVPYWDMFEGPQSMVESSFFHKPKCDDSGRTMFMLINDAKKPACAFELEYDAKVLWQCMEWRHFTKGEYCYTIRLANNFLMGAEQEEKNRTLEYIEPGKVKHHIMKLRLFGSEQEIFYEEKRIISINK